MTSNARTSFTFASLSPLLLLVAWAGHAQGAPRGVFLSWIDGPAASFQTGSADRPARSDPTGSDRLGLRSSHYGMLIDSRELDIPRMTLGPPAGDPATPVDPSLPESDWQRSELTLTAQVRGARCRARLCPPGEERDPSGRRGLEYPVRIIESGNHFQHAALYGIEWVDDAGRVSPGRGHVDLRVWEDRGVLEFVLDAAGDDERGEVRNIEACWNAPALGFSHRVSAEDARPSGPTTLRLGFRVVDGRLTPWNVEAGDARVRCADERNSASWDPASGSWEVRLARPAWLQRSSATYPRDLHRITEAPFAVENTGDRPLEVKLRFIHPTHPITGFVPMLQDSQGRPTGIPVQSSKNWHRSQEKRLPYEGSWIHGSAAVTVPPHSVRELRYVIVHTSWQGAPAASAAQLSLVGWGHNGFWTQMALGSWGEHVCIQPGRLQRRAFLTDLRPLMVLSESSKKPWGWTSNVGGCDTMVAVDPQGRYLPWGGVVSDFVAGGPNLAQVRVAERSADGSMLLRTDVYLGRSDDFLRVYLRARLEVHEDVEFQRLALFQLGADYYNSGNSTQLSCGAGPQLLQTQTPRVGQWEYVTKPVALAGSQPWVTLTGGDAAPEANLGGGTRGLMIRAYQAVLDGRPSKTPWIAGYRTQSGGLSAELVPPPGVKKLRKGDSVDMLLEVAVFPRAASDYYGADQPLAEQLQQHADTWRMTAWEAAGNAPQISVDGEPATTRWPPVVSAHDREQLSFDFTGGAGLVPVQIVGLPSPHGWQLLESTGGKRTPLGERLPEEAKPQVDFDRTAGAWTATLSLRPPGQSSGRSVRTIHWVRDPPEK
ncbi:hypothetical protein Pla175_12780 [Pirellulimonas nuda]|uniref:Uncharacterized protein n=1 Tax=Pirellulimonas nuda TaxID=2528009 RepID=A0A518D8V5_9BACT|nr:hypothetical protein [Pirellulimonas nuda]QDU87911.1 hypothetical protein Pla175_12780 [Pirellulimonas nuda]